MSNKIDAKFVVSRLNEFLLLDSSALQKLIDNRVEVSDAFRYSEVDFVCGEHDGRLEIGVIGLLNSLVDHGRIAAMYADGKIERFTVLSSS